MAKFKVGDNVVMIKDGSKGIVRARDIYNADGTTVVKYMVDFGGGIDKWKVVSRNDISKIAKSTQKRELIVKEYDHDNNQKLILVARIRNRHAKVPEIPLKGKIMEIGFSIYNGTDDYRFETGVKFALHRIKSRPFCRMESNFTGEFNNDTVEAIMDVKAKYIKNHWSEFYRPN